MNAQALTAIGGSRFKPDKTTAESEEVPLFSTDFIPTICWILSSNGSLLSYNRLWVDHIGKQASWMLNRRWWEWIDPKQRMLAEELWNQSLETHTPFNMRCRLLGANGNYRWHAISATPPELLPESNSAHKLNSSLRVGICYDVHDLYENYEHLAEKANIDSDMLNASVDCIKMINLDGSLRSMNRSGCHALGVAEDSEFGMKWVKLVPPKMRSRVRRAISVAVTGKRARFSGTSQIPGGRVQHWDNILNPMFDSSGKPTAILCVSREITLQRAAESRLRSASERDPLTGLLNRKAFRKKATHLLKKAKQTGETLAMVLVDLDHFKPVNDSYGHGVGDYLLKEIAKRITASFGHWGLISRLGGDEFAILLRNFGEDRSQLQMRLSDLFSNISAPVSCAGKQINGGLSAGFSLIPFDTTDFGDSLRKADVALTETKQTCKGTIQSFRDQMSERNFCSSAQLNSVRSLLTRDACEVRYAKRIQLNLSSNQVGFRADLKLKSEVETLNGPLPNEILQANHTIANESAALLRELVVAELEKILQRHKLTAPVVIKTPIGDLMRHRFAETLIEYLDEHNVAPHLLELEVHESVFHSRGSELAIGALEQLRRHGLHVSVGDFGAGLTSLAQLPKYPIDGVRLSRSLTEDLLTDSSHFAITQAVCQLCSRFGLPVTALGVDSEESRQTLLQAGCTWGEGYWAETLLLD